MCAKSLVMQALLLENLRLQSVTVNEFAFAVYYVLIQYYFLRATEIGTYSQSPETEIFTSDMIPKQCF